MATLFSAKNTTIVNSSVPQLIVPAVDMPALLGLFNFHDSASNDIDLSGAGATLTAMAVSGNSAPAVSYTSAGIKVNRTHGYKTSILPRASISFASAYSLYDTTSSTNAAAFPISNADELNTTKIGEQIRAISQPSAGNYDRADAIVYVPNGTAQAFNFNPTTLTVRSEWVWRGLVIDAVTKQIRAYTGIGGVLYPYTLNLSNADPAARDLTRPYMLGYSGITTAEGGTSIRSGENANVLMGDAVFYNGALTDLQAARAYSDARARAAAKAISL